MLQQMVASHFEDPEFMKPKKKELASGSGGPDIKQYQTRSNEYLRKAAKGELTPQEQDKWTGLLQEAIDQNADIDEVLELTGSMKKERPSPPCKKRWRQG